MLLLFFIGWPLGAMNQGVWDAYGNFLGPTPPGAQMCMMPVLMMPVPMIPGQEMQQPSFGFMPYPGMMPNPMFPIPQMPVASAATSSGWAATSSTQSGAIPVEETASHGAESVFGSDAGAETTIAPEVGEQDTVPKSPWPIASRHTQYDDDHDEEIAAITSSTERFTLDDNAINDDSDVALAESKPAEEPSKISNGMSSSNWADYDDDDDGPVALPADWKLHAAQSSSSASSSQAVAAQSKTGFKILKRAETSAASQDRKEEVNRATERVKQSVTAENRSYRDVARQVPPRFSKKGSDDVRNANPEAASNPFDQRFVAALRHPDNELLSLLNAKIDWLTHVCHANQSRKEANLTADLLEQHLNFTIASHRAATLVSAAGHCLRVAQHPFPSQKEGRIGFARIAKKLATVAQTSFGHGASEPCRRICEQADEIINPQKKNPVSDHAVAVEVGKHSANSVINQPTAHDLQHKRQRPGKKQRDAQAASFMTLDEKLEEAMQQSNEPRFIELMGNKLSLLRSSPGEKAFAECSKLFTLLEKCENQFITAELAPKLLQQARYCITTANEDTYGDVRKVGFARLAKRIVTLIEATLPAEHVAIASDLVEQANVLLGLLNRSQDQTDAPAEEFYAQHQEGAGDTVVRSDGKILYGMVSDGYTSAEEVSDQDEPPLPLQEQSKNKKKTTPKKIASPVKERTEKKKVPLTTSQESKEQVEPAVFSISKYIEELNRDGNIKGLLELYEQLAEGKVSSDEPKTIIDAIRTLGYYYLYGCKLADGTVLIKASIDRAKYFLDKAAESGDIDALLDKTHVLFDPANRAELYAHLDRLKDRLSSQEEQDAGTQFLRNTVRVCRAAAHYMDNETRDLSEAMLAVLDELHEHCSFDRSMSEVANALPVPFYDWMAPRLTRVYEKMMANNEASRMKQEIEKIGGKMVTPEGQAISQDELDWLYFMGRLCVEGDVKRFGTMSYAATDWIKAAADGGHTRAQLFLATPSHDPQDALPLHDRLGYLERVMSKGGHNKSDAMCISKLCNGFVREGVLKPIIYNLMALVANKRPIDGTLKVLEDADIPALRIIGAHQDTYKCAQAKGLFDELNKHKQSSWMARLLMSSLEIANSYRLSEEASKVEARLEEAIQSIEGDVKDHPQVEYMVKAGKAALGMVRSHKLMKGSSPSEHEKREITKNCKKALEQACAAGDDYAKQSYAFFLLSTPEWVQYAGIKDAEKRGVALFTQLAEQEGEHQLFALKQLAKHYIKKNEITTAKRYLRRAKKITERAHNCEESKNVGLIERSLLAEKSERDARMANLRTRERVTVKQLRPIQLVKPAAKATSSGSLQETVRAREDGDLEVLQQADSCVVNAVHDDAPFKALKLLKKAKELEEKVEYGLACNSNMLVLFCMALEKLRSTNIPSAPLQTKLQEELIPLLDHVAAATDTYLAAIVGPIDPTVFRYLNAYTYRMTMRGIRELPAEEQYVPARELLTQLSNTDCPTIQGEQPDLMEKLSQVPQEQFVTTLENVLIAALAEITEQYKQNVDPTLGFGVERTVKAPLFIINKNEKTD
jgi:hypothetical protein